METNSFEGSSQLSWASFHPAASTEIVGNSPWEPLSLQVKPGSGKGQAIPLQTYAWSPFFCFASRQSLSISSRSPFWISRPCCLKLSSIW